MISVIKLYVPLEYVQGGKKVRKLVAVDTKTAEMGGRLFLNFPYNKKLLSEVKNMGGRKWHGPPCDPDEGSKFAQRVFGNPKCWSIPLTPRNRFQLAYLENKNPYAPYNAPLITVDGIVRPLKPYQVEGLAFMLTRRRCILAYDMGLGKTLIAIELMERTFDDWWYVAPKSVLRAINYELRKWEAKTRPDLLTYDALIRRMKEWQAGDKAPRGVLFDESARCKTPTAQRTQAAQALADGIRADWGDDGFIGLMSGAPAPKSPLDWYSQCEIACPGFLVEGDIHKFRERLSITREQQSSAGGVFKQPVTWLDDERKCADCGQFASVPCHDMTMAYEGDYHVFRASKNEVALLYHRMAGLVLVKKKKDVLHDLPPKVYRLIQCKPKPATLRAARMIASRASSVAECLILHRELSDGFQYEEVPDGKIKCKLCEGCKVIPDYSTGSTMTCTRCDGEGEETNFVRIAQEVESPKDEVLVDLLDEHFDIGRFVTYAGFQASVDRIARICKQQGWETITADGRGWRLSEGLAGDPLEAFQDKTDEFPRICFVGNAGSVGEGQTLTKSPSIFFYSNDFNGNSRMQAEERLGRLGSIGQNIIDVVHLETDRLVLDNLKQKKTLQDLSMGQIIEVITKEPVEDDILIHT